MGSEKDKLLKKGATTSYAEADPKLYSFLEWTKQQDASFFAAFQAYAEQGTKEERKTDTRCQDKALEAAGRIVVWLDRRGLGGPAAAAWP